MSLGIANVLAVVSVRLQSLQESPIFFGPPYSGASAAVQVPIRELTGVL